MFFPIAGASFIDVYMQVVAVMTSNECIVLLIIYLSSCNATNKMNDISVIIQRIDKSGKSAERSFAYNFISGNLKHRV
jgi:hypothetical protein